MNKVPLLAAVIAAVVIFTAWSSREEAEHPKPAYVGARKCKVCHVEIHDSWKQTSHAKALAALVREDGRDPECLRCHTTGYDDGGYGSGGNVIELDGVQCEACHGAGSLYSRSSVMRQPELSRRLGLVRVDSSRCTTCHNRQSPTFKGFAYEAGLRTGTHVRKPETRLKTP